MTTLIIDCEFNSAGGQLLSMALVEANSQPSTADEFYVEITPVQRIHPWVAENVMPLMNGDPVEYSAFQKQLETFLSNYETVHIVADWPDDIRYFCEALITYPGERIDTPPLTMEVRRDLDAPSELPHNALSDARGIRDLYIQMDSMNPL